MATLQNLSFVPTQISGCQFWIDAADATKVTAPGGVVSGASDKSGNGITLSGGSGYTYPNNTFNGSYPSFYNASSTSSLIGSNASFSLSQPLTAFVVGQSLIGSGAFGSLIDSAPGGSSRIAFYYWNSGGLRVRLFAGSEIEYTGAASTFINSYYANTTSSQILVNGTSLVSGSIGSGFLSRLIVGNGNGVNAAFIGHICEILIYNSILSQSQRQQVEGYLAWKWGLQTSLPTSHPYYYIAPNSQGLAYPSNLRVPVQLQSFLPNRAPLIFFNPKTVSGIQLWLDGADPNGTGVLPSNGASISTWVDKSGQGNNATAGTAPTFNSTGINNIGVVSFNGSTTYLSSQDLYSNRSFSIFLLIRRQGQTAGNGNIILGGTTSSANRNLSVFIDGARLRFGFYGNDLDYLSFPSFLGVTSEPAYLLEFTYTPGTRVIYLNATSVASDTNSTNLIDDLGARIGGTSAFGVYYNGFIGEMIVLNGAPATTSRQQIEGYLAWKWGLQSSLPNNHPYKNIPAGLPVTASIPTSSFQPASFSPKNYSGLQIWLDSADTSTIALSGSNVTQWSDKSGNGRNATVYNGTPTFSAGNGITFNGSTTLQLTYTGSPSQESLFTIIKFNSVSAQGDILGGSVSGQREYLMYSPYSPGTIYLGRNGSAPSGTINGGTVTTGTVYQLEYVFDGTGNSITFLQNGTATSAGTPQFTYSAPGTTTYIGSYGSGGYLQGQIYEMIIYNTTLTTLQRQNVEGYLAWKWGLQGSLPTTHPFKRFQPPPN